MIIALSIIAIIIGLRLREVAGSEWVCAQV